MRCELCNIYVHFSKYLTVYTENSHTYQHYTASLLKNCNTHIICEGCVNRLDIEKRKKIYTALSDEPSSLHFVEKKHYFMEVMTDNKFIEYKNSISQFEKNIKYCFDEVFNNIDVDFQLKLFEIEMILKEFEKKGKVTYSGISKIYEVNTKVAKEAVEFVGTKSFCMYDLKEYDRYMIGRSNITMRRYFYDN